MSHHLRLIFVGFLSFCVAIAIPSAWESVSANVTFSVPANEAIANDSTFQFSRDRLLQSTFASLSAVESLSDGDIAFQSMHQAKEFYERGDYQQAANSLDQAVILFQERGDRLSYAVALTNLSSVYQKLGNWERAEETIKSSIEILRAQDNSELLARALEIQGNLWFHKGRAERSLDFWQEATGIYRSNNDLEGFVRSKTSQIEALQMLGLHQQARDVLEETKVILSQIPDSAIKVRALRGFGDLLRAVGELKLPRAGDDCHLEPTETSGDAEAVLQESWNVVRRIQQSGSSDELKAIDSEMGAVLLSSGNVLRAKGDLIRDRALQSINFDYLPWKYQNLEELPKKKQCYYARAEEKYEEAIATPSVSRETKVKAQINLFKLRVEAGKTSRLKEFYQGIEIEKLPPSRSSVYDKIHLAQSWAYWQQREGKFNDFTESFEQLNSALQEAKELGDKRAESYVLGNLGGLYEYLAWQGEKAQSRQYKTTALEFTQKALDLIQPLASPDLAYQWEWQLGRLFQKQNSLGGERAIDAYKVAIQSLDRVRSDLLSVNLDAQFSFRDNVEPIYRNFVDLLLQSQEPSQDNLRLARQAIADLQLAELENFLRESCAPSKPALLDKLIDEGQAKTAVLYAIVLPERLAVIVKLPQQQDLLYRASNVSPETVETTVERLRREIQKRERLPRYIKEIKQQAKPLNQWLIEPFKAQFQDLGINTLVFVLDGALQNAPIAAISDGDRYLVEDYAIAINRGLQLLEPQPFERDRLRILAFGLSELRPNFQPHRGFSVLEYVNAEITGIPAEVKILNEEFTSEALREQTTSHPFSVIHLATHGQFSSNPDETFILAWDKRIQVNELRDLIQRRDETQPEAIELLVLSACQTAQGDKRATLGLAGIAVRAGARSTLATLWEVNDEGTANFMKLLYEVLENTNNSTSISKAEALQKIQLEFMKSRTFQHPYNWSPFILVGNWL